MNQQISAETLNLATEAVAQAENELEAVLGRLQVVARSEKSIVTDAVERAFGRLRFARANLAKLQRLIGSV